MVQSLGVDIRLLYRIVFAAGVALAAFAGMIAAPVSSVYPGMGNQVLIISFVVVVIGGIGSVRGALVASLLVGLVDTFGKVLMPQTAGIAGLRADGGDPAVAARRAVPGRLSATDADARSRAVAACRGLRAARRAFRSSAARSTST